MSGGTNRQGTRAQPAKKRSSATYEDGDEPDRCRAKSKSTQQRCGRPKEPGYEVCRYHGAGGGRPPIHGRYSRRLGHLAQAYDEAMADSDRLLDLRDTLALLEVHVQRCAERAGQHDTAEFRQRALSLYDSALAANDPDVTAEKLRQLGVLLREGVGEDRALEALTVAAERLAVRQEKAWGIKLNAAQVINARDLVTVLARFVDIVLQEAPPANAGRILERVDTEIMASRQDLGRIEPSDD